MKKKLITILASILTICSIHAQDWNWGTKQTFAKGHWSELEQMLVESNYEDAQRSCSWLLKNAPELHENLYIHASKVYESLVKIEVKKSTRNMTKIMALQDTALSIYDKRMELYGNDAFILNRKGQIAYTYLAYREGKLPQLHTLYSKIVELKGKSASTINLTNMLRVGVAEYKKSIISKNDVLKLYIDMLELVNTQVKNYESEGKSTKIVNKNKEVIINTFTKHVKLNCEDAHLAYEEKFISSPSIESANRIYSIMSSSSCNQDPLFLKVLEYLSINEPKKIHFQTLSAIYYNNKEYTKAYNTYRKTANISSDSTEKASLYYTMASINSNLGKKSDARADALTSLSFDKNKTENYQLIGNLYMSSFEQCKTDNNVKSRAIFIAAYNMYYKAGDTVNMTQAKEQFPAIEQIFMNNLKEGDPINVGCWIGGSVKLVKR